MKVKCKNKKCMESNGGKSYEWEYKGTNPFYAPCPRCRGSVKLEDIKRTEGELKKNENK